ncbi:MAG: 4-(cytidine 5'-diphospho)-2-C-methyl-D-erythritol kinase [Ignavibacteria bacterium]
MLKANAKINIGLKVLGKRNDGYHNLETIFYPVNLCDNITLRTKLRKSNHKIEVFMFGSKRNDRNNICYKAAEKFLDEFKIPGFYNIYIKIFKYIPIGGGLGGGSSDAAAVLKGLYNRFDISGEKQKLKNLALSLGSDVPFFLTNKPALAKSRGDKIKVINRFTLTGDIILVNPGINVSTKWAFDEIDKLRKNPGVKKSKPKNGYDKLKISQWLSGNKSFIKKICLENDFEKVVFKKYPEIKVIKEKMIELGASFASMSGSGSSVYGIFQSDSNKPRMYFRRKGYSVFSV